MTNQEWRELATSKEDQIREAIKKAIVEAATDKHSGYDNKVYLWPDGEVTNDWNQPNTWPANDHKLVASIADYDCRECMDMGDYPETQEGYDQAVKDFKGNMDAGDIADDVDRYWDDFMRDLEDF